MTEYADLSELMEDEGPDFENVKLPNGKVVKVRGISRFEYMLAIKDANNGNGEIDPGTLERNYLRFGLVEPKMNMQQVETFTKKSKSAIIEPIASTIRRLSGLGEDAEKSELSNVRGES